MEASQLTRCDEWDRKLADFHNRALGKNFVWGEFDCCLLAADWVLELTGYDFGADFRSAYADQDAALDIVREFGGLSNMIKSLLEAESISANFARRGDICLVDSPLGEALGVCIGERCLCAGLEGAVLLSMRRCLVAWRVG